MVQMAARTRVFLLARHGGDAVVENNNHMTGVGAIVARFHEAGNAAVDKRGVANHGDDLLGLFPREHVTEANAHTDGGTHVNHVVHGANGREGRQRVAADVARDDAVEFLEDCEGAAVRAARAEHRRLALHRNRIRTLVASDNAAHAVHVQFAEAENRVVFGFHRNAGGFNILGKPWVVFFDDHETLAFELLGEILDELHRQRVGHAELEDACFRSSFTHMVVTDTAHDDAHVGAAHFHLVRAFGHIPGFHLVHLGAELAAGRLREAGHHHMLGDIALEVRHHGREFFFGHHDGLGVVHAGRHTQDDGNLELFARLHRNAEEIVGFLGVAGLEHRANGCLRMVAGILFVLGTALARVVGHDPHHGTVHARVGRGVEHVACHVEAHHLHGDHAAGMAKGCTQGHFGGDLLVRGPLGIPAEFRIVLEDFGRGGTRVTRGKLHVAVAHGERDGLVSRNQHLFRIRIKSWHSVPFSCSQKL